MEEVGVEKFTITVERYSKGSTTTVLGDDGAVLFQQYRPLDLEPNPRAQTFVDHFLKGLNTYYREPSERLNEAHPVGGNGRDLLYFVAERGTQTLNFKGKIFYFLLKYLLLKGEAATPDKIKGFYRDQKVRCRFY